jgi:hypothetical protein
METASLEANDRDPAKLRADLHRLDRRDWWRWAAAIVVMLLITAGVAALALPNLRRGWEEQQRLDVAVLGLFALVLLFDIFSVYQQVEMNRMRRRLAAEMGVAAAFEVLRTPASEAREPEQDRRRTPRLPLDQRLTVRTSRDGKEMVVYGRTSDICPDGIGAVVPESLAIGTRVSLELSLGIYDEVLRFDAEVCYRRGFVHGFRFSRLTPGQADAIHRACRDAVAVPTPRDSQV